MANGADRVLLCGSAWQYKDGVVNVRRTWEQHKSLVPYYLPECCTKLE